jgi:chemotaxis protein MotA
VDPTTAIGIGLGVGSVMLGHELSAQLPPQVAAALIVLGGTLGAVIAQFPPGELLQAVRQLRLVFARRAANYPALIERLVALARRSRKEGLLALEAEATQERDPFLRQALLALVDGTDPAQLRALLRAAIDQSERRRDPAPRLFEAAGGYAPTIGILGAVLGLIHVMRQLGEPSELGQGIAVAFVATVYGVGSANLVFLPLAGKLTAQIQAESHRRELIVEGLCGIQEGLNPLLLEKQLRCYVEDEERERKARRGGRAPRRGPRPPGSTAPARPAPGAARS